MKCPYCHADNSRVVDSREAGGDDAIRRRRECAHCHRRFTTYERVEGAGLIVVKKDGRRQEFDPAKLRQKLRVALTKRPVGELQIDAILHQVEADLLALGTAEVPSSAIGETVLRELKQLDEVAYIRFASVYRQFADLDELRREVEDLRERPAPHPLTRGAESSEEGEASDQSPSLLTALDRQRRRSRRKTR